MKAEITLRFIGRQGFCRYYWRIFQNGSRIMYAKTDSGTLQPVAGSSIFINSINQETEIQK